MALCASNVCALQLRALLCVLQVCVGLYYGCVTGMCDVCCWMYYKCVWVCARCVLWLCYRYACCRLWGPCAHSGAPDQQSALHRDMSQGSPSSLEFNDDGFCRIPVMVSLSLSAFHCSEPVERVVAQASKRFFKPPCVNNAQQGQAVDYVLWNYQSLLLIIND